MVIASRLYCRWKRIYLAHSDHELFFNPVRTSLRLRELARVESVEIEEDVAFNRRTYALKMKI